MPSPQIPEHLHINLYSEYDIRAYSDKSQWLADVWHDAFQYWDADLSTCRAADYATKAQDRAELFWDWYHR